MSILGYTMLYFGFGFGIIYRGGLLNDI